MPPDWPLVFQFGLDRTVVGFTAVVTLVATLLFGLAPALRSGRVGATALRDGGRSGRSVGSARFGSALVILQTAMAVVLLVGGGLLMKSISGMRHRDLGFEPRNVLTLRLAPPATEYPEDGTLQAFWNGVEDRVAEIPGVVAVGSTQSHPLMGSNWGRTVRVAGQEGDRTVRLTYLTPGIFGALGLRLVTGRPIRSTDDADAPLVAVVNETFVQRYLGEDRDPLASYLEAGSDTLPPVPIVGVVEDVVERGIDRPREPALYLSVAQAEARTRSLVIRTAGSPEDWVEPIQEAVWSLDPKLPLFQIETMEDLVDRRVGGFAVIANLMGIFALLSLFLGALGIYGVTAFSAGRRTAEIGVRLAMGAERRDVIRMVVLEGARRAGVGLALGLVLAFAVAGALRGILVGVEPRDPVIFGGVTVVLAGVAFLGLWLPARRASAVDPVEALAAE
jgi:predicted permease